MRSAVLCRSLNNAFGFDLTKTYSTFVSILKTFSDVFIALTELRKKLLHIVQRKNTQNFFRMKKPHKIFFAQKTQHKILLAREVSIRQLSALGCWNVTLLLLLLLQKKCEYHKTCCDYLVAAAWEDGSARNEMKKTTTFLSAGRKYGLRFVKKLFTHVQVLGVVAMGKEQQGCNASYCWQQPLLFSVEL